MSKQPSGGKADTSAGKQNLKGNAQANSVNLQQNRKFNLNFQNEKEVIEFIEMNN